MNQIQKPEKFHLKLKISILFALIASFWIIEILDSLFFRGSLDQLGVHPRSFDGLWGILRAPFLHGNFIHLSSNTLPFIVLGGIIILESIEKFVLVFILSTLCAGAGAWILGASNSVHIGASGVVFGFLGFLLLDAFFERSIPSFIIAAVTGFLYGGALWGVLPTQPGISWQSHLFGFIGGALSAKILSRFAPPAENNH